MWRVPRELLASDEERGARAPCSTSSRSPQAFLDKVHELYAQPEAESLDTLRFRDGRVFERYSHAAAAGGRGGRPRAGASAT